MGTQLLKYTLSSTGLQTIDGFDKFKNSIGRQTMINTPQVLPFEKVTALYVDKENNLWIGTELGIYVFI